MNFYVLIPAYRPDGKLLVDKPDYYAHWQRKYLLLEED